MSFFALQFSASTNVRKCQPEDILLNRLEQRDPFFFCS